MGGLEVWFLTGSQDLYGEETVQEVAANAAHVVATLDASEDIPVRIVSRPVVRSSDEILATLVEASASESCIGVIAWMHTFSPARMWIAGLQALRKPLLHLHTQFNRDLPWAEIDMDFMNLNQAAHGDREFGYIESRLRVPRKTVVGHWADPYVAKRIAAWARAAAAVHEARHLRVARFGDNMRNVAVTEGDKVEAQIRLGVTVNGYSIAELTDCMRSAADRDVDELVRTYEAEYELAPELRYGHARHQELREGARIELGLRAFLDGVGAKAFTDTFEDLGAMVQLPGIAVQRMMADGYGFGAEGDWKSAVLVRLFKVMATGLPGGTSFMEDYTYHFDTAGPRVLGAHMLEVCPSIAAAKPRVEIHPLSIGGRRDPIRLVFDAAPGPAFVTSLVDLGERFRLVANTITIVSADEPLPRLPVARAVWQPDPDLRTSASAWLMAGGAHHTVLTRAFDTEPLVDFAEMTGIELVLVDASSTIGSVTRELRWNAAYYRLARGL